MKMMVRIIQVIVVVLFIICGIACAFTALCYSDFASRIPVAGSAYTYAYASFGEVLAWIIGWALLMEFHIADFRINIWISRKCSAKLLKNKCATQGP